MLFYIPKMEQTYLLVVDTEYDGSKLLQFSAMLLRRTEINDNLYQVIKSVNSFIQQAEGVSPYVTRITGITSRFLQLNGETIIDLSERILSLLSEIDDDYCIVGHGLSNDLKIIESLELPLNTSKNLICTYELAKRTLPQLKKYNLTYLTREFGVVLHSFHNSMFDCVMTAHCLSMLQSLDEHSERRKNDKDS